MTKLAALPMLLLVASAVVAQTPPTSAPASQPVAAAPAEPGPKGTPPSDKKAPEQVDIRKESKVLEDVWRHRAALHFLRQEKDAREAILKTIATESARSVKHFVENEEAFTELDYHYVEKMRNCEQRLLGRLRADKFQGIADLLEVTRAKSYPASEAYADLLNTVELNLRFAIRRRQIDMDDAMKELARRMSAEAARLQGTAGHTMEDVAKALYKETKPEDFPAHWFDRGSEIVSYEFGKIPDAAGFARVDLAAATKDDLCAVPELEPEIADAILKYRAKNGIQGPEELRFIEEIPAHLVAPLQTLFTVARGAAKPPKKAWTVMVYLNAANNLEPFGIKDMNEMELAGSNSNVNVVVECARFHGKQRILPNSGYLANPFAESSRVYYWGLDNEPGTRRYYILKDDDKMRIRSVLVENIGETDAGRPEPLADFGTWAVENYPAEHYAIVIWNHGAGWSGVSSDENTHHGMDMPDVRWACEKICGALAKQGKEKIDVLDFDACLMATLEVGYELKDTVDYLAASQETEPGDGMIYSDYLKWLATYPEAPPVSLAKAMTETYVHSYAPGGEQAGGPNASSWSGSETKSVIRLARTPALRDAVEEVAKILQTKPDLLGDVAEQIVRDSRRFGRLVDIHDFFQRVADHLKSDAALRAAVAKAQAIIGYPNDGKDPLVNEVVITRRSAGSVVWGWNGWCSPPQNLAPFVSEARYARTPLVGPDAKGNYTAKIVFPPMLTNPKTGKPELVKQIDYKFDDDPEKRVVKDFQNSLFTADFPRDAVVAAEGHNIGTNRSHGISLYFPAYLGFDKDYRRLRFSEGSAWAQLCEKFPIKKIEKRAPIAMLGINHATKADREELGKIVVREELEKKLLERDWAAPLAESLKKLERPFDSIRDPRPFGEDWAETLAHYENGVVVLDNTQGGEVGGGGDMDGMLEMMGMGGRRPKVPRIVGPEGRDVMRHLRAGGNVLLGCGDVTRRIWDTPLYRDTLGIEYVRTWNRGYKISVRGEATAGKTYDIETERPGQELTVFAARDGVAGVEPFATLADGQWVGAKIRRTDPQTAKTSRAVVLGFYLADVKGPDERTAILKEALAFLTPTPIAPAAAPTPSIEASTSRPTPEPAGTPLSLRKE
jgi:DNA uptake protein ComE-like DNA-binding protein